MEVPENTEIAKQFCIVYDKETLPMANSLFNKVHEKGYSCVLWSEKQYHDQKPELENDIFQNKTLFLSRKCVKECFANPHLKPLAVDDWSLIYSEGINAGIGLEWGADILGKVAQDPYVKNAVDMLDKDDSLGRRIKSIPAIIKGTFIAADQAINSTQKKEIRATFFWKAVDVFYEHYLDDFMKGKPLKPIKGVTKYQE